MEPRQTVKDPMVIKILDASALGEDGVNREIEAFVSRWHETHSITDPLYILAPDGSERVVIRADDVNYLAERVGRMGALQAIQKVATETQLKAMQSSGVQAATAREMPVQPPKKSLFGG